MGAVYVVKVGDRYFAEEPHWSDVRSGAKRYATYADAWYAASRYIGTANAPARVVRLVKRPPTPAVRK